MIQNLRYPACCLPKSTSGWGKRFSYPHCQVLSGYPAKPVRVFPAVLVHLGIGRLLPGGHRVLVDPVGQHERAYDAYRQQTG